jgi:allophanate hydrolase
VTLSVEQLLGEHRAGVRPAQTIHRLLERLEAPCEQPVWITRVPAEALLGAAEALDDADPQLALYGIPFAVKDNIDVAGLPSTAACPGFSHIPMDTAPVVQRLLDAGALLVGKTNMDQFATGLVGTRSPYGRCSSVADPTRVSGGSSSGSALAVALGHVAFSLGTDTAGSGRVPAAFNGLIGLKPSRGLLSTRGVLPACASLDCVSIFATQAADAARVFDVAAAPEPLDPWSRAEPAFRAPRRERIGVPLAGQVRLEDALAGAAWERALAHADRLWTLVPIDVEPLLSAAPLLYDSWVAERTADLGELIASEPDGLNPIVAEIVLSGRALSATDAFDAQHRLVALQRAAAPIWEQVDALLLPTTPIHPTHAEVDADPIAVNARLGTFTNFVNLMDMCALAVPGPARADGLPFGVSIHAPSFHDRRLLELGCAWRTEHARVEFPGMVRLAVAGAHMSAMALNERLTVRGARLLGKARTAAGYRLYALAGAGEIPRPGLVRVLDGGASIDIELWELAPAALGELLSEIPAPLAIGRVELAGGEWVTGFVCEGHGREGALDISDHGGWRAFLESGEPLPESPAPTAAASA